MKHTLEDFESLIEFIGGYMDHLESNHKHKCESCGFVWNHKAKDIKDGYGTLAHTCVQCGKEQWYKHNGDDPSRCINTGEKQQFVTVGRK
jgi:hypothetical protein